MAFLLERHDHAKPIMRSVARELLSSCVLRSIMTFFCPYTVNKACSTPCSSCCSRGFKAGAWCCTVHCVPHAACVSSYKGLSLHLAGCRSSCLFSRRKSLNSHWARRILQQLPQSQLVQKSLPRYPPRSDSVMYRACRSPHLHAVDCSLACVKDLAPSATLEQRHRRGLLHAHELCPCSPRRTLRSV